MSDADMRDFEKYIDQTLAQQDEEFLRKLGGFSQSLLQYVSKGRKLNTYDSLNGFIELEPVNLHALINNGLKDWNSQIDAVTVGRFILITAKPLRARMRRVIEKDFPKFLGEKANFWRYLMHLISKFSSDEGKQDFTSQFLIMNACYVELVSYCYEIDQYSVMEHDKLVWIIMMLHYFGDRLKEEQAYRSVLNFPLIANKTANKTGEVNVSITAEKKGNKKGNKKGKKKGKNKKK